MTKFMYIATVLNFDVREYGTVFLQNALVCQSQFVVGRKAQSNWPSISRAASSARHHFYVICVVKNLAQNVRCIFVYIFM